MKYRFDTKKAIEATATLLRLAHHRTMTRSDFWHCFTLLTANRWRELAGQLLAADCQHCVGGQSTAKCTT